MGAGDTPQVDKDLAEAIAHRDFAKAAVLIRHGARVNRVMWGTETFDRDVVEETTTYLINAAARGEVETIRFLLGHGADPNISTVFSERTALLQAAAYGHAEAVDLLLAHHAEVSAFDLYDHKTAIGYAIANVRPAIVRSLLNAGAQGSFRRMGFSVEGAARAREVVQLLVAHGTDINEIDDWGRTPLMWAAEHAEADTLRFMIGLGADVSRVSEPNMNGVNQYDTALSLALRHGRADIGGLLLAHGARDKKPSRWMLSLRRFWPRRRP